MRRPEISGEEDRGKDREGNNWPTSSHQAAHTLECTWLGPFLCLFSVVSMKTNLGITIGNALAVDLLHISTV